MKNSSYRYSYLCYLKTLLFFVQNLPNEKKKELGQGGGRLLQQLSSIGELNFLYVFFLPFISFSSCVPCNCEITSVVFSLILAETNLHMLSYQDLVSTLSTCFHNR